MNNEFRRNVCPPRAARLALRLLLRKNREFVLGDLEEQFQEQVDSSAGLRGARRWYWRQVWECVKGFGDAEVQEADARNQQRTRITIPDVRQNFRYAIRSFLKSPAFTITAVLTLALGIGPNTALFSIVDAVLLRPLSFADPDRLVVLWETDHSEGDEIMRVAPGNYQEWKKQADVFKDLAAFGGYSATLLKRGEPLQLKGTRITSNYFSVLGVHPMLGRVFGSDEQAAGAPVAVLGYGLWQSRFGASRDAIGATMVLDGSPYTVIGVMPPGVYPTWPVNGPRIHFQPEYHDVWVPFAPEIWKYRQSHVMGVVGRMKESVTLSGAQKQMDVISRRLAATYPENKDEGALVRPLIDEVTGSVRPAFLILIGAVAVVLFMACLNVAGLLVARLTAHKNEIAVRTALGAGRSALLVQFLVEGLLLTLISAALGIFLASQTLQTLLHLVPQEIPRLSEVRLNLRVLAFTLGISCIAAVLFALAPAWASRKLKIADTLKETARGTETVQSQRLRRTLVVLQVSFAVVLTVAAVLLTQSFRKMKTADPGFRADHLLVAEVSLSSKYSEWQQIVLFFQQLRQRTEQLPGVNSAAFAYDHPLQANWMTGVDIEGKPTEESPTVQLRIVSPGYFASTGQRIVEGREFTEEETNARPGVAIVNETFVKRYFPEGNAIGRIILSGASKFLWDDMPDRFEIIAVVADVQSTNLHAKKEPFFYVSLWQFPLADMKLLVRTSFNPEATIPALRTIVRDLDNELPVGKITTMETVLAESTAQSRLTMILMGLFGGLALILALIGIYGLVAFWVATRRQEIGMRMALGARSVDVVRMILQRGGRLIAGGIAAGILGSIAMSGILKSQLFGISALDPLTYVVVCAFILVAGLLACVIPASSAAKVDPMTALRSE